jgi:hypothetical protein
MTTTLKQLLGDAGAGIDESHGSDRLYDVLVAIVTAQNDLVAQFNQLLTDYNAETLADHTTSTATAVTAGVAIE